MDNRALGVFDSGLGGLTAVKRLHQILPHENIIFFADNGHMPFGGKPVSQLRFITKHCLSYLASFDAKAILVACGTSTSVSEDILSSNPTPTFGVISSAVSAMSRIQGAAPLGIIATEASIKRGMFHKKLAESCPKREIISIACPDFVPLIESGHTSPDDAELISAVSRSLKPLKEADIAALLLGCTHYGIISEAITAYLGSDVKLISASECAADELCSYIVSNKLEHEKATGKIKCFTSGDVDSFIESASAILGFKPEAEYVEPVEVGNI